MRKYQLKVGDRETTFIWKPGEEFSDALQRGAAKLGHRGGAFWHPNHHINHLVTVLDSPSNACPSTCRCYTGICIEI